AGSSVKVILLLIVTVSIDWEDEAKKAKENVDACSMQQ
ncbi:unnamed protein product, partial [Linum tenue]